MKLLRESGVDFERVDYTKTPLSKKKLGEILKKAGLRPAEAVRKKEAAFKTLGLDRESVTDAELLAAMVAHPELIQRPLVEKGARAVLGRPVDAIASLL